MKSDGVACNAIPSQPDRSNLSLLDPLMRQAMISRREGGVGGSARQSKG